MKELFLDNTLTYKPFGAKAILIEWKPIIDEAILQDILEFKDKIKDQKGDLSRFYCWLQFFNHHIQRHICKL